MAIIFYQDFIAMIFSINHQIVYYLKLYMLLSRILIAFYYLMYPLQASFFDWWKIRGKISLFMLKLPQLICHKNTLEFYNEKKIFFNVT